jgi:hypothetical protein
MSDKPDIGDKMGKKYYLDELDIVAIMLFSFITGMLVVWGVMLISDKPAQTPVCHAITEDSVITDCNYHNGAWWSKW